MILNVRDQSLVILMSLIFSGAVAFAQTETATVSGRVTDPSGSIVPGTEVDLQSVEQGTIQKAASNGAGIYSFPSVQPGQYHMTLRKAGFRQIEFVGLVVNVQDHIEKNFQLQVGSTSESITVSGGAPLVNTEDASVSTVVDRNFAENLPMNGRSFQTLIQLTPGVVLTPTGNGLDTGQFSVNGQRASSNYWMVDGVSANIGVGAFFPGGISGALGSFSAQGGTNSLVSVDALQEFRIQTSTYAPEFGRVPGAQISILTRSGTNEFHGTAFDYFRNDVLDANNWFNTAVIPALPKAEERQNDFGGTLGGPILKDRTFFFFSYEGLRLRLPQTTESTVPDFVARKSASPALRSYLNAYPLPSANTPDDITDGIGQFNASFSNASTLDAYSLRIDHKLTEQLRLFGRYNYSPSDIIQRGGGNALSVVSPAHVTTQTATAGATWIISSTWTNDLRINYSRTHSFSYNYLDNFGGAVPLTALPLPSPFSSEDAQLSLDVFSLSDGLLNVGANSDQRQRQINLVDALSVERGSHNLKFGVDFRRLSPVFDPAAYAQDVDFNDVPSFEAGNILESVLFSSRSATLLFRNLGVYAQDTWRIAPRLTLTYGLRWDLDFAPSSLNGPQLPAATGFNLNNLSELALAPPGTPPFKTTYTNVAPRLGIAYQLSQDPKWQTVLRGGFGVFFDLATEEVGNVLVAAAYPFSNFSIGSGGSFPLSPAAAAPPPIVPPTAPNAGFGTLTAFDPNLKLPYTLEWNIAFEQGLGHDQSLSASYIGSSGRRLLQTEYVYSPTATLAAADLIANTAVSDYDALQLQFQRRLSRSLQALASYTWSHSIDTGSAGSYGNEANTAVPTVNPNANRGPSDFDIRSAFSSGMTYDIPSPGASVFAKSILSGWAIENVIQASSAPPVNLSDGLFFQLFGGLTQVRPDVVPGQPFYLYGRHYPGEKAFNPAAFTSPPIDPATGAPLRQGNVGRNALRGFGAAQWDLAVHRDFPIHESISLQFRAEMFNVLNHPNFGQPIGDINNPQFGESTMMLGQYLAGSGTGNGSFSPLYQIGGPRSIQLALKLRF